MCSQPSEPTTQRAQVQQTVPLLLVDDIPLSRDFYCDGLGFQQTEQWEQDGKLGWCWLQHGTAALMLQQAEEVDPPAKERGQGVTFYFLCDDVTALHADLTHRGTEVAPPTTAFYGMQQIFLTDPDGYQLCFESRVGDQS